MSGNVLGNRRAEGVVGGVPALLLLHPREHREAVDPDVGEDAGLAQAEPIPHRQPHVAERLGAGDRVGIGDDEDQVAG